MKIILAVETSCDDTSVAIVKSNGFVLFNKVINQDSIHKLYGGVVPELASRNHAYHLLPIIQQSLKQINFTWEDIQYLAVTNRPGLVGSLLVGLVTVKTISALLNKPFVAVNHIEGHILSAFLWDKKIKQKKIEFPFLSLIVSGGHTYLLEVTNFGEYKIISKTIDDAAGETLDKIARTLELGYPGGAQIDKISKSVTLGQHKFPKIKIKKNNINFSFSGLKTSALQLIQKTQACTNKQLTASLCADFQEAVMDQIMDRLNTVASQKKFKYIVISGGVSANSRLRKKAQDWAALKNINLVLTPLEYCTDNAAMIGLAGIKLFNKPQTSDYNINCYPYSLPEDFT